MKKFDRYPILEINLSHMKSNVKNIVEKCSENEISVTGVVKATDTYEHSYNEIANIMISAGCTSIGDSRMNTIKRMREMGFNKEILLLRVPMMSELDDVVKYSDCSLQSELNVLKLTNEAAKRENKIHSVILMMDLGDLREGFFDEEELIDAALMVENEFSNLYLKGIGTNLGCYGAICPDEKNLGRLVNIAERIEGKISRTLDIVSGGGTSSLPMVLNNTIPKGINHLRIGEGIVLSRDLIDIWKCDMPFMYQDIYTIYAQVIEVKEKPSYPIGKIFIDAFGNTPEYEDLGIRKRALLALGKRDIGSFDSVSVKLPKAIILGGSSDHLILDIDEVEEEIRVGDVIGFDVYYGAMVFANNSSSVYKRYIK
ncbi:alanine/ornithine racemase family PLP-dependent enzyme [Clostridium sp. D2Q-14]|uniref:alanine racemase n=1 Tax=Anaeromonas gelatinilytica TaxID=2683194 RepID=UPI00193C5AB9|nr:alanine/ornithine racemase family PLP-dependent enzyme [Anaeromonas gelatinilytica]MBS4536313.1 alanine/ornithine racemase family PLP-dependent enzyme [Anaeromonas gelatinilytica]